jgi:chorismate mutase/prephenate dehydrogenase
VSSLIGQNLLLVGGRGQMGRLFAKHLTASGVAVQSLDLDNWGQAQALSAQAAAVIVTVPLDVTLEVVAALPPLPETCVLADLTSIKQAPLAAMLARHPGPVLGLHPLFGPDIDDMKDQRLVYCPGRGQESCAPLLALFRAWGLRLVAASAAEHDRNMALVQGQRHFINFCLGANLMRAQVDFGQLLEMGTPAFYLEMMQMGRLFSQPPELYADIIMAAEHNFNFIREFCKTMEAALQLLASRDRNGFIKHFAQISAWLGEHGDKLNRHSKIAFRQILSAINRPPE